MHHKRIKFGLNIIIVALLALPIGSMAYAAEPAHDFELAGKNGPIKLSDYRGKVVYLDFWASWCTPCRKSFPWMNEMQKKYSKQGLAIIAINLDSKKKMVDGFLKKIPANFDIAYDPEGRIAKLYQVKGMPSSYIIDRNGRLRDSHMGFRSNDKQPLEKRFLELLNEK